MQQYKFVAATCMMKDVLPTLTKLSVFFQKESVGLASVPAMVSSTITTLQALRDDLNGDLANLPSLKELNQGVLADGLYHEKDGTHPKCLGPQFDQTCGYEDPE